MSIDFRSSLIITGWVYLVVALIFIIQLKTNPLKKVIPYWIATFILAGIGVFIQIFEIPFNERLTPMISNSLFITGGTFLVFGASKYLNIGISRYFYYGLISLMVAINGVFSVIFPNDIALKSSVSILYIVFLIYSTTIFLKGIRQDKNVSWIMLLLVSAGTIIFLIIRIFHLLDVPIPQAFQQIFDYINIWFISFNALIILGVVITIATYHLKLLNNNILMRDTMYGVVGHDLKEPLTHIYSLSNLALSGNLPREQCKEIMVNINSMALNANYLARNLLEWAYVSRKGLQPVIQKININKVLLSEIELYKTIAKQKQVSIQFTFNEQIVLNTDENMFRIIIRNLINNAVKFSKPQSEITIEMGQQMNGLQIRIKDKGVGIDSVLLNKLNNPAPDKELVSNGMGLYLTKTYVHLLHADLVFESAKDSGTTAILTLYSLH